MEYTGFEQTNVSFSDNPAPKQSLDNIFKKHHTDAGQYHHKATLHKAIDDLLLHEDIDHLNPKTIGEHHEVLHRDISEGIQQMGGFGNLLEASRDVTDSIHQHKYAKLANSSYDYFNSNKDAEAVHRGLRQSHVEELKGFRVDEQLSTRDNVVLYNSKTGETHISYRGTTDDVKRTKQFLSDWKTNSKIAFNPKSAENRARYVEADKMTASVVRKYDKKFLTVSGHSQGGWISSMMGQKYDVTGFHFNPAISLKQVSDNSKGLYKLNNKPQNIFKTHMDFASPLAITSPIRKYFNVALVGTKKGLDKGLVNTHSIDHFFSNNSLKVTRNSMVSSVKNSVGKLTSGGLQGYFLAQDIREDLKDKNTTETTKDIGVDITKNVAQYIGDEEIMAGGIALAPETLGLSIIGALGFSLLYNMATDHIASGVKNFGSYLIKDINKTLNPANVRENIVKVANVEKKAFVDGKDVRGRSLKKRFKNEVIDEVGHKWAKTGRFFKKLF